MYANQGFRTLTFGFKELTHFDQTIEQQDLECKFNLVGVTAVEDLLQLDVEDCLIQFKEAGIKVWMLTGDKGETARMIGISCGLLKEGLKLI